MKKQNQISIVLVILFVLAIPFLIYAQETQKTVTAIATTKMNVVYVGLDNPVTIAVSNVPSVKINVTASTGTITKVGEGQYTFQVTDTKGAVKIAKIYVSYPCGPWTCIDSQSFRILYMPKPELSFGSISGGQVVQVSKNEIIQTDSLYIKLDNFLYDGIAYKVTRFELIIAAKGKPLFTYKSENQFLTTEMKNGLKTVNTSDRIIVTNIFGTAYGSSVPKPVERAMPDMVLNITDCK